MTECKFKVGDRVYDIRRGVGVVHNLATLDDTYTVVVEFTQVTRETDYYTMEGRASEHDLNPMLLTLSEARGMGYDVPKLKVKKEVKAFGVVDPDTGQLMSSSNNMAYVEQLITDVAEIGRRMIIVELTGIYEVEE